MYIEYLRFLASLWIQDRGVVVQCCALGFLASYGYKIVIFSFRVVLCSLLSNTQKYICMSYSVFQLGIFLRALRPARTVAPCQIIQRPARIIYNKQN